MARIPIPEEMARRISDRAVQYAREEMQGRGWSSSRSLQPFPKKGQVGIKTSVRYLLYQESGTKPFLMKWVEGRTIGMGCKMGDGPHFRRGSHVGEPGYVDIPHVGRVWRKQKWLHPGLKPTNIMHNAIRRAIQEERHNITQDIHKAIRGEYR